MALDLIFLEYNPKLYLIKLVKKKLKKKALKKNLAKLRRNCIGRNIQNIQLVPEK